MRHQEVPEMGTIVAGQHPLACQLCLAWKQLLLLSLFLTLILLIGTDTWFDSKLIHSIVPDSQ